MFRVTIRMTSSNAVPDISWGTLMHGMLIEHLYGAWPGVLHQDTFRPVSQWVEPRSPSEMDWHIQLLDDNLAVCFLESCQEGDEWFCQHNSTMLTIGKLSIVQQDLREYIDRKLMESRPSADTRILFKTTTTHKSKGKYVIFPSVELIANSLRNRLCEADESITFPDSDLEQLTSRCQIHSYQLQSSLFGLEGSWVRGYTGQITLRTTGPESVVRLGNMLFGLAPWFGIGIKTTLGMGGCLSSHA